MNEPRDITATAAGLRLAAARIVADKLAVALNDVLDRPDSKEARAKAHAALQDYLMSLSPSDRLPPPTTPVEPAVAAPAAEENSVPDARRLHQALALAKTAATNRAMAPVALALFVTAAAAHLNLERALWVDLAFGASYLVVLGAFWVDRGTVWTAGLYAAVIAGPLVALAPAVWAWVHGV